MVVELDLREASGVARASTGKRRRAKIIAADVWGSTAYYPADVLERDGARVFTAGTQMFENHLTDSERWDRPEGDVSKLIGKLTSDALYEAAGEDGPGLYADVEFYDSYLDRINEIADDVGISVRASGITEEIEMDGRYGPVLVALLSAQSVDVVTKAGAGGRLTSILESDREKAGRPIEKKEEQSVTDLTKEDLDAFQTSLIEAIKTSLTEALKPAAEEEEKPAEVKPEAQEENKPEEEEKPTSEDIDHAAIVEALRENELPAQVAKAIVSELREGKTLDEAIKNQVDLREAFVASQAESGHVVINESQKPVSGLARAVQILG